VNRVHDQGEVVLACIFCLDKAFSVWSLQAYVDHISRLGSRSKSLFLTWIKWNTEEKTLCDIGKVPIFLLSDFHHVALAYVVACGAVGSTTRNIYISQIKVSTFYPLHFSLCLSYLLLGALATTFAFCSWIMF